MFPNANFGLKKIIALRMGKLQKNVFVLLGKDPNSKKFKIDKIKTSLSKENQPIISLIFFSSQLSIFDLQKEVENLSFSRRIFIFKNSELLSKQVRAYLLKVLKEREIDNYFIFDFDLEISQREELQRDSFFSFLFKANPAYKIAGGVKDYSLRDLAKALKRNSPKGALLILSYLLKRYRRNEVSMKVLGLIVKLFVNSASPLLKKRNLKDVFKTDRLIKEGNLNPQTALEFLILKLTSGEF